MITNILLFVTFLGASHVLSQVAMLVSARRQQAIRVKAANRRG